MAISVGESPHVSGMCLAGEKRFLIVVLLLWHMLVLRFFYRGSLVVVNIDRLQKLFSQMFDYFDGDCSFLEYCKRGMKGKAKSFFENACQSDGLYTSRMSRSSLS